MQKQAKDELNYAGASERELLTPLLQQSSCSYKVMNYVYNNNNKPLSSVKTKRVLFRNYLL